VQENVKRLERLHGSDYAHQIAEKVVTLIRL
jgi:hypothetical protein